MLNCYPVAGKNKSIDICEAFAKGAGRATVHYDGKWRPGHSFFWGVNDSNQRAWDDAILNTQFNWYYGDNSYFDATRGTYFRVTKMRLQHSGMGESRGLRFPTGVDIKPWREEEGRHIVVCPQSDDFMRRIICYSGNWLNDVRAQLALWTTKKIVVRAWNRNKTEAAATLHDDLVEAHACVVWSSAAGVESVLAGVPTVVMGQSPARLFSVPLQSLALATIPHPAGNRVEWASVLADNQWTVDEMRKGTAWRSLNKEHGA